MRHSGRSPGGDPAGTGEMAQPRLGRRARTPGAADVLRDLIAEHRTSQRQPWQSIHAAPHRRNAVRTPVRGPCDLVACVCSTTGPTFSTHARALRGTAFEASGWRGVARLLRARRGARSRGLRGRRCTMRGRSPRSLASPARPTGVRFQGAGIGVPDDACPGPDRRFAIDVLRIVGASSGLRMNRPVCSTTCR